MTKLSPNSELNGALRKLRSAMGSVALFSGFINLLMLAGPLFMLQIYDRVLPSHSVSTLVVLFLLVAVLYVFLALFNFIRSTILNRAALRFEQGVISTAWTIGVSQASRGEQTASRPVQDISILRRFISGNGPSALFDLPWVPIYLAFVFMLHVSLGWLTVAGLGLILGLTLVNEVTTNRALNELSNDTGEEESLRQDCLQNADAITSMGMTTHLANKWHEMRTRDNARMQGSQTATNVMSSAIKGIRLLLQSGLLALGAYLAIYQEVSMGAMIAASIVAGRAFSPVDQAVGSWSSFVQARISYQHIQSVFANHQAQVQPIDLPKPSGPLALSGLLKLPVGSSGKIDAKAAPILQGIDLLLEPGDGLGVIGPSASGKSTLAQVLVGLQRPDRGSVRLDGALYEAWDKDSLGRYIGYLPQQVELLSGTVRENISRFEPSVSDESILAAARISGAHDVIMRLPGGYGAKIGSGGSQLSGGQAQRIALARAVYGSPSLVVLDEPNSNLDADGDNALKTCIQALKEAGSIVVVMTHRPSVISAVNKVLVLNDGRQMKFGKVADVVGEPASPPPFKLVG
ncbi:MAG: type I secretion system permease/ATPase [Hyphomicrobiales bacterium]